MGASMPVWLLRLEASVSANVLMPYLGQQGAAEHEVMPAAAVDVGAAAVEAGVVHKDKVDAVNEGVVVANLLSRGG